MHLTFKLDNSIVFPILKSEHTSDDIFEKVMIYFCAVDIAPTINNMMCSTQTSYSLQNHSQGMYKFASENCIV